MSRYSDALAQEGFGHVPLLRDRVRDEDGMPFVPPRRDGVYFHMKDRRWKVQFGGTDRFETFAPDQAHLADNLFDTLQAGGEP